MREGKLEMLCAVTGKTVNTLNFEAREEVENGPFCTGICSNPDCLFTAQVRHAQSDGACERCGTKTVVSALVLQGIK